MDQVCPVLKVEGHEVIPLSRSAIANIVDRAVSDKPVTAEEVVQLADMALGFIIVSMVDACQMDMPDARVWVRWAPVAATSPIAMGPTHD